MNADGQGQHAVLSIIEGLRFLVVGTGFLPLSTSFCTGLRHHGLLLSFPFQILSVGKNASQLRFPLVVTPLFAEPAPTRAALLTLIAVRALFSCIAQLCKGSFHRFPISCLSALSGFFPGNTIAWAHGHGFRYFRFRIVLKFHHFYPACLFVPLKDAGTEFEAGLTVRAFAEI